MVGSNQVHLNDYTRAFGRCEVKAFRSKTMGLRFCRSNKVSGRIAKLWRRTQRREEKTELLVWCLQRFFTFGDFAHNSFYRCAPDKNLGILIVSLDVVVDSGDQIRDVLEGASTDALVGNLAEPALHHVQPRAGSGIEMQVEAVMAFQPGLNGRR